jgi:hypothetical protein
MHCQPTEDSPGEGGPIDGDPVAEVERTQRLVLNLVVDKQQRPWSIHEVVRSLDGSCSKLDVEDAICLLQLIGLINQADEIVFASQAAAYIERLGMLTL